MPLTVTRPTCRPCPWIIDDDIPSRLTPWFLYDSGVPSSIYDENGVTADQAAFTGNVRRWDDLSGNNQHMNDEGIFTPNNNLTYDPALVQPDSKVVGITDNNVTPGDARRLTYTPPSSIAAQDFEMYLLAGFTVAAPPHATSFFGSGQANVTGAFQIFYDSPTNAYSFVARQPSGNTLIPLNSYTPGINIFRLRYEAAAQSMEITMNGRDVFSASAIDVAIHRFDLFTNRNRNVEGAADIKFLSMFQQLLDPDEFKGYMKWLKCAWNVTA